MFPSLQCEVREVDCHWGGTISLGVTSLSPRHACLVEKAQELKKRSYILCTECGRTCFYVGGKVGVFCPCQCVDDDLELCMHFCSIKSLNIQHTSFFVCKRLSTPHRRCVKCLVSL